MRTDAGRPDAGPDREEGEIDPASLFASPNALAPYYARFRVADRLLLTGHSHQAWPDRGFEGQKRAWWDAAELVDDKWDRAFEKAGRVRAGFAALLGDAADRIALGASTHELLVRFLSGLALADRPRLVTTDGEFHTIRRQLARLEEEGLEIVRVPTDDAGAIAERVAAAVDDRTSAALVSSVLFRDARIVPGLGKVQEACTRVGAELLVDAYHHVDAVPLSLTEEGLEPAYVVGGGYKYCQLGEGNCFLRVPAGCELRPVVTGWFAEFGALAEAPPGRGVRYGRDGERFAGATYDPTSHYRAAAVLDFFDEMGLVPELLRRVSQHQVGLLARRFDELDADPAVVTRDRDLPLSAIAGFLALRSPYAAALAKGLRDRGVRVDHRDDLLRLGPAPYLSDAQLERAIEALGEALESMTDGTSSKGP